MIPLSIAIACAMWSIVSRIWRVLFETTFLLQQHATWFNPGFGAFCYEQMPVKQSFDLRVVKVILYQRFSCLGFRRRWRLLCLFWLWSPWLCVPPQTSTNDGSLTVRPPKHPVSITAMITNVLGKHYIEKKNPWSFTNLWKWLHSWWSQP